jgi:phenylacetate-CoA ligase
MFTYKNFVSLAEKNGMPLTLLPIGPNIASTISAIKDLGKGYDQILLMGYPPFIKEVLDRGGEEGINWGQYNMKLLMAAEGFTEGFRHHVARVAKLQNPYRDMCNIYGSVELGTMGYEGALSYFIREHIAKYPALETELLGERGRMPTIAQYHPYLSYFEEVEGEVLCSGYASAIPLLRYRFPDRGGVIGFDRMIETFKRHGIDLIKLARRAGIEGTILRLPFVYVFERPNNTITYRGANIYADQVKDVLDKATYKTLLTGRFTIEKKESKLLRQTWVINIELKEGVKPAQTLNTSIAAGVLKHLLTINTEFADQYRSKKSGLTPTIRLHKFGAKKYFSRTGKQAWVMKK